MIKAVIIEPITLTGTDTELNLIIEFDTAALYALYVQAGINPENIIVPTVTESSDGYEIVEVNLKTAFDNKDAVRIYTSMNIGFMN